jgi:hypothetical protein
MTISRRVFLQSASASFGAALLDHLPLASSQSDLEKIFEELRANLLEMVNEERDVAKVPPLIYADRTRGTVDVSSIGTFKAPVRFFKKEPGILYDCDVDQDQESGKSFSCD